MGVLVVVLPEDQMNTLGGGLLGGDWVQEKTMAILFISKSISTE